MKFRAGEIVTCTTVAPDGAETRRVAEFIRQADPDQTVIYRSRRRDAAWVRLLDGEDEGLAALAPIATVRPVQT